MSPRVAVTVYFALNGFVFSSFYARLPAIKDRLDLSSGELGIALLGATVGLVLSQPLAGAVIARRGSASLTVIGAIACALSVGLPAFAPSLGVLVLVVAVVGFSSGMLDVAMNAHAVLVERRGTKKIFSAFHAWFSLGALGGAASAGVVAGLGVGAQPHLLGVVVFALALGLIGTRGLLPGSEDAGGEGAALFVAPSRELVGIGAIAFAVLLCEGAVSDWSAVHLKETLGLTAGGAAFGLACFHITMAAGRLLGDRITDAVGPVRHVRAGSALAGGGLVLAALAPNGAVAIAGFAIAGCGISALFPLAMRAGAERSAQAGPGIAAISTTGYAGLMTGPPLVGFLAEGTDLRFALAVALGGLALTAFVLAPAARPRAAVAA